MDNSFTKLSIKARAIAALRHEQLSDELVRDEVSATHLGHLRLEWAPLRPGTLNGWIGDMNVSDDGDGSLWDADGATRQGTVNYLTGDITLRGHQHRVETIFSYAFRANTPAPLHRVELRLVTTEVRRHP